MATKSQVLDITRSYVPGDPNSFPENLIFTEKEDGSEKVPPIVIYEGYNFIPTAYGYRSYFGDNSKLNIDGLTSRCDELFIYQLGNLKNIIIALCEDGIWYTASTTLVGALWTHGVTLTVPSVGTYKQWTFTVIENVLYMYRQGEPHYWKVTPTGFTDVVSPVGTSLTITAVVPSFLNMSGQLGIFRANASLAFWDSATSIGWSSPLDLQDFTPSVTTFAGNSIFSGILGSIVTVKSQGDGFIIYTTKGIVGVRYVSGSTLIWEATTITDTAGISSPKEVTSGMTENEHFAYTSTGIKKIGSYNALNKMHSFENILPEIYDILRENEEFVYLNFMNGRYLFFSLLRNTYISGRTTFTANNLGGFHIRIRLNGDGYSAGDDLPTDINGEPLNEALNNAINNGQTSGMYTQWSGSGVGSFSEIVTPMHYYEMDQWGNLIPNNNYSGALFDASGFTADTAPLAAFVSEATPTYPTDYNLLKRITYPSIAAGISGLGTLDSSLSSYLNAQVEEWANFGSIQEANVTQIQSIPEGAPEITLGIVADLETPAIMISEAITAFAASKPGSIVAGNSVSYIDLDAGSFLSGVGTTVGPTITGVGTSHAHCTLSRTFLGGYNVKKRKVRTYTATREGPVKSGYSQKCYSGGYSYPEEVNWPTYTAETKAAVIGKLRAFAIATCSAPTFKHSGYTAYKVGWVGSHPSLSVNSAGIEYTIPGYNNSVIVMSHANTESAFFYTTTRATHYLDYTETSYVEVTVNPTITATATLNAYQSYLDWSTTEGVPNYTTEPSSNYERDYPPVNLDLTYPGATFLLQDGTPAPIYPTYEGALVLDTALKKWGKMKAQYKAMLDYNSFNSANQNIVSYSNLGVNMAILKEDGYAYNMDAKPLESYIRYGKIGYNRQGFTNIYEVKTHFRGPFVGSIILDTSINGAVIESTLSEASNFDGVIKAVLYPSIAGRWHTIKISGNYDLQYLEFRANMAGRR